MTTNNYQDFRPDRFQKLKSLLQAFKSKSNPSAAAVRHLYSELDQARPWFLLLLRVPGQKKEERDEVQKGIVTLNSKPMRLNQEFITETLFLSDLLNLSELLSVHLLHAGMAQRSRHSRPGTDVAIIVWHKQRLDMLECLQIIFSTEAGDVEGWEVVERFGKDLRTSPTELAVPGGKQGSLVERAVLDLDLAKDDMKKLHNSLAPQASTSTNIPFQPAAQFNMIQSTSTAPAAAPSVKLSNDMTLIRIDFISQERENLSSIIYLLAEVKGMRKKDIQTITRWLSRVDNTKADWDLVAVNVLTAVLACFDLTELKDETVDADLIVSEKFLKDTQFMKVMSNDIIYTPWACLPLQSVVILQWTLTLVEAFGYNRNLAAETGITQDDIENLVGSAIRADAFQFLTTHVIGAYSTPAFGEHSTSLDGQHFDNIARFRTLNQVDLLISNFIQTMSQILRKMKHKEEDLILASSRGARPFSGSSSQNVPPAARADIEGLFGLISALYRDCPPDFGVKYWLDEDGRLFAFLRWAADARTPGMICALFEMLASLSVGPQSSTCAYNFLSNAGGTSVNSASTPPPNCSWQTLFNVLQNDAAHLPKIHDVATTTIPPPPHGADTINISTLSPEEVPIHKAFLRILKNVVFDSPVARAALVENQSFKAIQTLLSLVNCYLPIDLKAVLFDTLAAFCSPEGGSLGGDIARQMWVDLERYEVVPTAVTRAGMGSVMYRGGNTRSLPGGTIAEMTEVELQVRSYPATSSFVNLLNSLIHTPGKSSTLLGGFEVSSTTIPDSLGADSRIPGIGPYVQYVLDDVFLKAWQLEFAVPAEKWSLLDRSLCFIEKCLSSYDLSPLLTEGLLGIATTGATSKAIPPSLAGLATHPGYEIVRRLLSDSNLLKALLQVAAVGIDSLNEDNFKTPLMEKSVLRSLRIIYRILQIQNLYVEVLIPTLSESRSALNTSTFTVPSSPLTTLDEHLLYSHQVVIQIALYVRMESNQEIELLSVRILEMLAQSPYFMAVDRFDNAYGTQMNRLAGIIDSSNESLRIAHGFVALLETLDGNLESPSEDVLQDLVMSDNQTSIPTAQTGYIQPIQLSIMDLLLANTTASSPGPNFAHFLLGIDLSAPPASLEIEDPANINSRISCLHVIFKLLNTGSDETDGEESLLDLHPVLADKCAKLIYQLSVHPLTASAMLRYLRTREDYCFNQLSIFPLTVMAASHTNGEVLYSNGATVSTSAACVTSLLRYRASVLDTTSLELHVINPTGQHASRLVQKIFGTPDDFESRANGTAPMDQPLALVIEILQSLDFDWRDAIPTDDLKLTYFANLDFSTCLKQNSHGCEVYDFRSLLSAMNAVRRYLQRSGAISSPIQHDGIKQEAQSILEVLRVENHKREVGHARHQNLVSWQQLLNIVLLKSFTLIPQELRETLVFEILSAIFRIMSNPEINQAAYELLSESVLTLLMKLRETRRDLTNSVENITALPAEQLHTLFRQVIDCLTRSGTTEMVRGNLYAVITNYFQLISASAPPSEPHSSLDSSYFGEDLAKSQYTAAVQTRIKAHSSLIATSLMILNASLDRLIPVICRDCLDGSEIWKTVAFSTLDTLFAMSAEDPSSRLLTTLFKNGFLRSFVQSLKDADEDLIGVLNADPENLNCVYVYESKTALLIRIAQTKLGAERLIDARLLEVLGQCYFIDARPEIDQSYFDLDSFLPPAIERYHQLIVPALQVMISTLSTLAQSSQIAIAQALSFISSHRETILIILKENSSIVPLASVKELSLLVTLCNTVLPIIPPTDLGLPSGYGGFHLAILTLAGKFFVRERWMPLVAPATDSQRQDATIAAPGVGVQGSIFERNADNSVEDLNKALLAYMVLATQAKIGGSIRPVLVPSITTKEGESIGRVGPATISAAIGLLFDTTLNLKNKTDKLRDVTFKLAQPVGLTISEIEEILSSTLEDNSGKMTLAQRQKLAMSTLLRMQKAATVEASNDLYMVETLLLLIWRHILYYINEAFQATESSGFATVLPSSLSIRLSQSTSEASLGVSQRGGVNSKELWNKTRGELSPVLERLEALELTSDIFGPDASLRQSYLGIFVRRLRELDVAQNRS